MSGKYYISSSYFFKLSILSFLSFRSDGDVEQELQAGIRSIESCEDDAEVEISLNELAAFPPFLRFDKVVLTATNTFLPGGSNTQTIATRCKLFEDQLNLIKPILSGSLLIFCTAVNRNDPTCFYDHTRLLIYLRRLLLICDSFRGYEFVLGFTSDKGASGYVISSILQIPQIRSCSYVEISFIGSDPTNLPVEDISNWLHRKCDGHGERKLRFISEQIKNRQEMVNHLKEVHIFIVFWALLQFLSEQSNFTCLC